jgi:thioredoxin reductase
LISFANFRSPSFPCLFQFGYEERGSESAGILVVSKLAAHVPQTLKLAGDANKFAKNIVLYTNGNDDAASQLETLLEGSTKYQIDKRPIKKLVKGSNRAEVVVEFTDGEKKTENFLVHQPFTKLSGSLPEQLSLEMTPFGDIKTAHPFPATNVPRIYAAGDCASPFKNATMAIASGICAGNGIARDIPNPNPLVRSAV